MGDFLAFSPSSEKKQSSAQKPKQSTPRSSGNASLNLSGMPAFGSPAINYGGASVPLGSPAATPQNNKSPNPRYPSSANQQYNQRGMNNSRSPRANFNNSYSPRSSLFSPRFQGSNSPRHQTSYQCTPSPYRNYNTDSNNFKTPHQYSPNHGRGGGRRSFAQHFEKNTRYDPNSNAGGSTNIEVYYNPSMVQDPWLKLCPVLAQTR